MRGYLKHTLLAVLVVASFSALGQEYDDLYFSKKDRKKVNSVTYEAPPQENASSSSFLSRQLNESYAVTDSYSNPNYSTGTVSPESIEKYKRASKYKRSNIAEPAEPVEEVVENRNFSIPEDTYQDPVVVNNYYGGNPWAFNNTWRAYRNSWRFGWGWQPWGSSLWISNGWGGGWGAFDPFWDPFFYSWNRPFFAGNFYNPWGGFYDPFWCPPFFGSGFRAGYFGRFGGFYRAPVVVNYSERAQRNVARGARSARGGNTGATSRSSNVRDVSVANSIDDNRNYSQTQAEYLNRSRQSVRVSNSSNNNVSTPSRNSRVNNSSRNQVNRSSNRSRNTSRQRSYSAPSNNRSSSPNIRSSSPSRSSGYRSGSSRSGSSRSSGSFRSSGSSGRSSGSRSSGGSRSGSSRSRRGN